MKITYTFNLPKPNPENGIEVVRRNRQRIMALEESMKAAVAEGDMENTLDDWGLRHTFTEGAVGRTLVIPKGHVVVGKIHRHAHFNVILRGKVQVMTPEGGMEILEAPTMFVSKPGTKRAVYAIEETEWTTIHVTEETDIQKIEDQIIAKDFSEFDALTYEDSRQLKLF